MIAISEIFQWLEVWVAAVSNPWNRATEAVA